MPSPSSAALPSAPPLAAIYGRVSTDHQDVSTQDDKCSGYCTFKGFTYETYLDEDISGGVAIWDRPQGRRLMEGINAGRIKHLVVSRLDRLGRRARDVLNFVEELDKKGVVIHIIDQGGIFSTDGVGRLLLQILAVVAEFERTIIVERIRDKMDRKFARGEATGGTPPYGWNLELVDGVKRFVDNPSEQNWLRRMREWQAAGWTYQAIMRQLNAQGVPTKTVSLAGWTWGGVRSALESRHALRFFSQTHNPTT